MTAFRAGLKQAMTLGGVALVVGGAGGWLGTLLARDVDRLAAIVAYAYLSLAVLWPLFLVAVTASSLDGENRLLYRTAGGSLGLLLIAGLGGAIVGTGFFFVPATNVPAILGVEEPAVIQQALFAHIGWTKVLLVVAVTSVVSLALAGWAHGQARGEGTGARP
jgi:hypothetical protein